MRIGCTAPKKELESIRLEQVNKVYHTGNEDFYALKDICLTIHKGDFISIVGPSGSGKSTLLHMVGLLDSPTTGKVYIDGVEVSRMSRNERSRVRGRKIGFVFQSFNLIPSLSALENVALPMLIQGVSSGKREARAKKVLEDLGMGEKLANRPNQLSGGQKQRVAIARALVNDPEIVLADEPTGNLDSKTGKEVLQILSELHHAGRTIAIITHDESITRVTHETIRIRDGRIVEGV